MSKYMLLSLIFLNFSCGTLPQSEFQKEGGRDVKNIIPAKTQTKVKPKRKRRIAVLELGNDAGLPNESIRYLSSSVRHLAQDKLKHDFIIITKENMMVLLPPDKNIEDCVGTCSVDTGRLIGADVIVSGNVNKFQGELKLSLNASLTKDGSTLASDSASASSLNTIEIPLRLISINVFNQILGKKTMRIKTGDELTSYDPAILDEVVNESGEPQELDYSDILIETSSVNLDDIDFNTLRLYEHAVKTERDRSVDASEKISAWSKLITHNSLGTIAKTQIGKWRKVKARNEKAKQLRLKLALYYKEMLRKIRRQKAEFDRNVKSDWSKVSELLRMSVVPNGKKLEIATRFILKYGTIEKFNPYIQNEVLFPYVDAVKSSHGDLLEKRNNDISDVFVLKANALNSSVCKIEDGVWYRGECKRPTDEPLSIDGMTLKQVKSGVMVVDVKCDHCMPKTVGIQRGDIFAKVNDVNITNIWFLVQSLQVKNSDEIRFDLIRSKETIRINARKTLSLGFFVLLIDDNNLTNRIAPYDWRNLSTLGISRTCRVVAHYNKDIVSTIPQNTYLINIDGELCTKSNIKRYYSKTQSKMRFINLDKRKDISGNIAKDYYIWSGLLGCHWQRGNVCLL